MVVRLWELNSVLLVVEVGEGEVDMERSRYGSQERSLSTEKLSLDKWTSLPPFLDLIPRSSFRQV